MTSIVVRKIFPVVGRAGTLAANILMKTPGVTDVQVDTLTETDDRAEISFQGTPQNLDVMLADAGLRRE